MRLLGFLSVKLLVGRAASGMEVQTNDAEAGSLATPAPEDELGDADAEPGENAGAFNNVVRLPCVFALLIPSHRHWDCAALLLGRCMSGQLPVKHLPYQHEHSLSACYSVTPPVVYAVPEVVAPKRRAAAKRRRASLPKLRPEDSLGQTDLASQR